MEAPRPAYNAWQLPQQHFPPLKPIVQLPTEQRPNRRAPVLTRSHSPPRAMRRTKPRTPDQTPVTSGRVTSTTAYSRPNKLYPTQTVKDNVSAQTFIRTPKYFNCQINNSNLFSPQELIQIFQDMLGSVRRCNSKEEQLSALMKISMKYLPTWQG